MMGIIKMNHRLTKFSSIAVVMFLIVLIQTGWVLAQQEQSTVSEKEMVERGEYLVKVGGCNDCHTPKKFTERGPVPDQSRTLSGHPANLVLPAINPDMVGPNKWILFNNHLTAAVGLWGVSFSTNLTPDDETGIGKWTEDIFINALRAGKHMGAGRPILPPMPWQEIGQMKKPDLKAIFAYLKSLPPIKNQVPAPIPPNEVGLK